MKFRKKRIIRILAITGAFILFIGSNIRFNFFETRNIPFLNKAVITHRGLYTANIPENSLGAFQHSIDKGLAIELDVIKSKDNYPMVFHDDNLERLTNGKGLVKNASFKDLQQLTLKNSNEKIPTLKQVLELVNGQVALLVEVKNSSMPGELEKNILNELKSYNGDVAIQSFNPFVVRWFKNNAPTLSTGLILGEAHIKPLRLLRDNIYSYIAKPNFLTYQQDILISDKTLSALSAQGLTIIPYVLNINDLHELEEIGFDSVIIHMAE